MHEDLINICGIFGNGFIWNELDRLGVENVVDNIELNRHSNRHINVACCTPITFLDDKLVYKTDEISRNLLEPISCFTDRYRMSSWTGTEEIGTRECEVELVQYQDPDNYEVIPISIPLVIRERCETMYLVSHNAGD